MLKYLQAYILELYVINMLNINMGVNVKTKPKKRVTKANLALCDLANTPAGQEV